MGRGRCCVPLPSVGKSKRVQKVWRRRNKDRLNAYVRHLHNARRKESRSRYSKVVKKFRCQQCGNICGRKHEDGSYTGNRLNCPECRGVLNTHVDSTMAEYAV